MLKEEIRQVITEDFMEVLLEPVNQNMQSHARNSKTPKKKKNIINKEYEKIQKQI
jgi:hypothetical protein